ncbi:PREDICTED: uncharacterized protein LOC105954344 [Erythranthe guttata]|uniref:uncharacterized protein LOC105954344 n=1 Tax=Erythranthe guttata TaxID=4155 RepID=UPI00064DCF74|nr:PREDICTED: uncharacterized protein LOC105954344 [Erythranthe guttata]|eukprot:XP_012833474.1 PREDICTED: uncharacterized protein LOC105954344 [Erythranthe guttata]
MSSSSRRSGKGNPSQSSTTEGTGDDVSKSDIWRLHYKKIEKADGTCRAQCNYCKANYAFKKGDGYGSYWRHLRNNHPQALGIDKSQTQLQTGSSQGGQRLVFERLKRPRSTGSSSNRRLELDQYLTIRFDFPHDEDPSAFSMFDILDWWKSKSSAFPIMSKIAKDVLACPVSTVAVEAAFSIAGHILDQRRSNLRLENLEAQVCLDNWGKSNFRHKDDHVAVDDDDDCDEAYIESGTSTSASRASTLHTLSIDD